MDPVRLVKLTAPLLRVLANRVIVIIWGLIRSQCIDWERTSNNFWLPCGRYAVAILLGGIPRGEHTAGEQDAMAGAVGGIVIPANDKILAVFHFAFLRWWG